MKVTTKAYGLIDVDERQKIRIPQGLFGFENLKDYVLLDAEQQPFYWLQSVDEQKTAFILINPVLFRHDYEVNANNEDMAEIGLSSLDGALVFSLVTALDDEKVTANLQGPLIINRDTREGKQIILNDLRWTTKHDIMAELAASGTAAGGRK